MTPRTQNTESPSFEPRVSAALTKIIGGAQTYCANISVEKKAQGSGSLTGSKPSNSISEVSSLLVSAFCAPQKTVVRDCGHTFTLKEKLTSRQISGCMIMVFCLPHGLSSEQAAQIQAYAHENPRPSCARRMGVCGMGCVQTLLSCS